MFKAPYIKEAIQNLFKEPLTKTGNDEKENPDGYRGRIEFNKDVCIGCGLCQRVCSPGAIDKITKSIEGGQEITMRYDLGSCTYCGFCSEICPKKALTLTKESNIVVTDKKDLIVEGTFIKKLPSKPPPKINK